MAAKVELRPDSKHARKTSNERAPRPDTCLVLSRRTRFRGGTLIAHVHDLAEHQQRLRDSKGYRPKACPRCSGEHLHLHDRPQRVLAGEPHNGRIDIVRYICANETCGATWRVLPAFVARHLWRRWTTVARTIAGDPLGTTMPVPARTRRRWNARLRSSALQLVHLLSHHRDEDVVRFASLVGLGGSRRELIEIFIAGRVLGTHALADVAATIHALEPGVRLI